MRDVIRNQSEGIGFINRCVPVFDGKPKHIEIRDFKRPKTAEQRAKFHILVRELAIKLRDENGVNTSPEGLKVWFKDEYGPAEVVTGPNGRERMIVMSSEKWSVEQSSAMIDHVLRVAAEHGHVLDA